jgi:hypothetical protein
MNDLGNVSVAFKVRPFAPSILFAQRVSMITPQDNHCIFRQIELLEAFQDSTDLRINITDAGIVAVT